MPTPIFNAQDQLTFNGAYHASLAPDLLAFMALPYDSSDARYVHGQPFRTDPDTLNTIAAKHLIDTQIMLWGWDPYMTTLMRVVQGYGWVYGFGQGSIPVGPGIDGSVFNPPLPSYNPSANPPGSIKVSLNPADYAPYNPPAVTTPTPTLADPVGFLEMPMGQGGTGDWYSVAYGDLTPIGKTITNSRGTFTKEAKGAPFVIGGAIPVFWVKQ